MKVEFLRDFRGRATAEHYYTAGTVADLPDWQAAACLAEGAVCVVPVADVPEVPVTSPLVETGVAVSSSTATPAVSLPGGSDDYAAPAKPVRKRAAKKAAK
jgi:hypothetical protein